MKVTLVSSQLLKIYSYSHKSSMENECEQGNNLKTLFDNKLRVFLSSHCLIVLNYGLLTENIMFIDVFKNNLTCIFLIVCFLESLSFFDNRNHSDLFLS